MPRWLGSLVCTIATLLAATRARGQDVDEAISRARAALRASDPARAIAILDEARATSANPEIDLELYVAHEQAGHRAEAAAHLAAYLDAEPGIDEATRTELAAHLDELREGLDAPVRGSPGHEALRIAGWAQLGAGIAGLLLALGGGGVALALENGAPPDCRTGGAPCDDAQSSAPRIAWTVAAAGLGSGLVLTTLGAVYLALAGEAHSGASRSLPPDLDPSLQRPFAVVPWLDGQGAGVVIDAHY